MLWFCHIETQSWEEERAGWRKEKRRKTTRKMKQEDWGLEGEKVKL